MAKPINPFCNVLEHQCVIFLFTCFARLKTEMAKINSLLMYPLRIKQWCKNHNCWYCYYYNYYLQKSNKAYNNKSIFYHFSLNRDVGSKLIWCNINILSKPFVLAICYWLQWRILAGFKRKWTFVEKEQYFLVHKTAVSGWCDSVVWSHCVFQCCLHVVVLWCIWLCFR